MEMGASDPMQDIGGVTGVKNSNSVTCIKNIRPQNKMVTETCLCERILGQNGKTCVKDDTVKPADTGGYKHMEEDFAVLQCIMINIWTQFWRFNQRCIV